MTKLYQVFVSSTYKDLIEEREAVIRQLQDFNFIPAGMELFKASPQEKFDYIKKEIDHSDYYVLIIGSSYGSIYPVTGKSYTQTEYDYAKSKDIPILTFYKNIEITDTKQAEFKKEVTKHPMCKSWENKDDLVKSITASLFQVEKEHERPGWIRGGLDISELSADNDKLRTDLSNCMKKNAEFVRRIDNLEFGLDKFIVKVDLENRQEKTYQMSWECIFKTIFGSTVDVIERRVAFNKLILHIMGPPIGNRFISEESQQTILHQFSALKLLKVFEGTGDRWIGLTEDGKKYLQDLYVVRKSE